MYTLHPYLRLYLLFIPSLAAQSHIRAKAPAPTAAPLFLRQISTCDAGYTSCNDGRPGCCGIGEACTVDTSSVPLCLAACNGGPTCSGGFNGHCCEFGFTCDYQATLCGTNTELFSTMSLNGNPAAKTSAFAAPSSVAPAPQPLPPPGSPTASQPALPSAAATSSLKALGSSLAAATNVGPSPSYDIPSFSLPSVSAYSHTTPTIVETSIPTGTSLEPPTPTAVQPATVTATVKSSAGQRIFGRDDGNAIVMVWLLISILGLAMVV